MRLLVLKRRVISHRFYSINTKLTNLHVKGTLSCLKSKYWDLSPTIGLLNSAAPSLLANIRQVKSLTEDLTKDLFYQRSSKGKRYGPVAIGNSKSLPIKWLNVEQMGHIVGLAYIQHQRKQQHKPLFDANYLDNELKRRDISCNYVNDNWTGISFARYRKMINQIAWCMEEQHLLRENYESVSFIPPNYGLLSLMQCIWDKANCKEDILKYYQAVQDVVGDELFAHSFHNQLETENGVWSKDFFSHQDISSRLDSSWNKIFSLSPAGSEEEQRELASSMEIITASLAVQAAFKGAIRQGRYSYSSPRLPSTNQSRFQQGNDANIIEMKANKNLIPARPDCVEVVVREIIDNLIYDTSTGKLDINLLPPTSHPALRRYYERFLTEEISDIPFSAQRNDDKKINPSVHYSEGQNSSAGEAWFQVCCNLPHGEYLCHVEFDFIKNEEKNNAPETEYTIPKIYVNAGKPAQRKDAMSNIESYELAPTLKNVCTVLGQLLNHSNFGVDETAASKQWTRLEHLAAFWNDYIHSILASQKSNVHSNNTITVQESRSIFRAPLSDTEMIYRDIGYIHVGKSGFLLQAELEPAHQLAAVKYVRANNIIDNDIKRTSTTSNNANDSSTNNETLWQQFELLHNKLFAATVTNTNDDITVLQKEWKALFQSILFPNESSASNIIDISSLGNVSLLTLQNQFLLLQHRLVSGKYGEEKWKPAIVTQTGDIAFTQSTMSLSLAAQANAKYSALLTDKLHSLVDMALLIAKMKQLLIENQESEYNSKRSVEKAAIVTNESKKKKTASNSNRSNANTTFTSFHQNAHIQGWEGRWSELAQWFLVDVHSDLTAENLETFIRSMSVVMKLSKQTSGAKEMKEFLQVFFIPYLLQYRGGQDGLYLSLLCSMMMQHGDFELTLVETLFPSESTVKQLMNAIENASKDIAPINVKSMKLTWPQRWKLAICSIWF